MHIFQGEVSSKYNISLHRSHLTHGIKHRDKNVSESIDRDTSREVSLIKALMAEECKLTP